MDTPRIPGLTEAEYGALSACWGQLQRTRPHNELRTAYYDLDSRLKQISNVIPQQYYHAARTLSWNTRNVDKLVERSTIDAVNWADGDVDDLGWGEIARDNFIRAEINSALVSSVTHGVSWLVASQGIDAAEPDVMVHAYDALQATGLWNGRTRRLDAFMAVDEYTDGEVTGVTLWTPNLVTVCRKRGSWTVERSEHQYGVPAEPVVYRPRPPRRPFGYSRITKSTMDVQDRALRTLVRLEGMSDIYSFAEQFVIGATPDDFVTGNNGGPNPWGRMMGRWKGIADDSEADDPKLARVQIEQLQAQSPDPHIAAFRLHAGIFSGETGIPITELGVIAEMNSSTQDSSENSQQHLIDAADSAKEDWTPQLQRIIVSALAMKNGIPADEVPSEWRTVQPVFRDSRFISRSAAADAGLKLIQAVPWIGETSIGLSKLGLSQQEIDLALAERRRIVGRQAVMSLGSTVEAARVATAES